MKKVKTSKVLREAARLVAEGEECFSCCAVQLAATGDTATPYHDAALKYKDIISPNNNGAVSCFDFGFSWEEGPTGHRVLALLFAAEYFRDLGD